MERDNDKKRKNNTHKDNMDRNNVEYGNATKYGSASSFMYVYLRLAIEENIVVLSILYLLIILIMPFLGISFTNLNAPTAFTKHNSKTKTRVCHSFKTYLQLPSAIYKKHKTKHSSIIRSPLYHQSFLFFPSVVTSLPSVIPLFPIRRHLFTISYSSFSHPSSPLYHQSFLFFPSVISPLSSVIPVFFIRHSREGGNPELKPREK